MFLRRKIARMEYQIEEQQRQIESLKEALEYTKIMDKHYLETQEAMVSKIKELEADIKRLTMT